MLAIMVFDGSTDNENVVSVTSMHAVSWLQLLVTIAA